MAKKHNSSRRPGGSRPVSRKNGGGVGPGPAYRPTSSGGGTRHQPGTSSNGCAVVALALPFAAAAVAVVTRVLS